ncbi:uncharacterized protein BX663DRAFT_283870 [Cokeromyces recurvatus]|uniref:uncharacterized protein n=1 Tax=Cokeromyces recurvatus TaxID=90255 RepID=UPI0022211BF6|nr:uncharacterized protein BX663DRAFT_283870 [Cokeromyces recurvatus]KAI7905479.1 hypothetical protein BX663DRAFT_283870 [Cokeromyces recurvatus]
MIIYKVSFSYNRTSMDLLNSQQSKLPIPTTVTYPQTSTKIQTHTDTEMDNNVGPRMIRTKSHQSNVSVTSSTNNTSSQSPPTLASASSGSSENQSRQQTRRSESSSSLSSFSDDSENNENRSCYLARKLSNESVLLSPAAEKRLSSNTSTIPRKNKQAMKEDMIIMLQNELKKEKSFIQSLQGQKEAIAKDLDYFCKLVDDITDEKDEFKRKYDEEKLQNELLRNVIADMEANNAIANKSNVSNESLMLTISEMKKETIDLKQQLSNDKCLYTQDLGLKNNEINQLKAHLEQTQRQIQILRKTMEQLLKTDGKTFSDDIHEFSKELTRKRSFMIEQKYYEDYLNKSKDEYSFLPSSCYPNQYVIPFNRTDNSIDNQQRPTSLRSMPEDFSIKMELSKRRKEQLKEILGEVDSQLNKVKRKVRPSFDT